MAPRKAGDTLNRARVLAAALRLADTEGLKAVTMRALAASLGIEAMSLYHHLPGKEGLLDGLVEAVVAEIHAEVDQAEVDQAEVDRAEAARAANGAAADGSDWRARLRGRCLTARAVMLRHPWAPGLIGSRTSIPTSVYAYYEAVLATLIEGGFSYHLGHRALHALGSMALGFTQELFAPDGDGADPSEEEMAAMAEAFPHITAMVAAEFHAVDDPTIGWCDSQTEFEFTLDLLLDGLDRAKP